MLQDLVGYGRLNRRQARKYAVLGSAAALSAALAYQAYRSNVYGRGRAYVSRLQAALQRYSEALATGGELCASVLRDLQQFLESERDDVPHSLRQMSKLLQSPEFTSTATRTVEAVYRGVTGEPPAVLACLQRPVTLAQLPTTSCTASSRPLAFAAGSEAPGASDHAQPAGPQQGALDKVLEALLSDRGHSLVSVAVSMGAKNMVAAYIDASARAAADRSDAQGAAEPAFDDKLFSFMSTPAGQQLAVMAVAAFASNGMRIYMDKSLEINFYEDLFSSMAKPAHLEAVKQCVSVFARDVVAAYLNSGSSNGGSSSALAQAATLEQDEAEPSRQRGEQVSAAMLVAAPAAERSEGPGSSSFQQGESLSHSPASSSGSEVIATALSAGVWQQRRHDDLDSDSLLHARVSKGAKGKRSALAKQRQGGGQPGGSEWISAVGREWLTVSKDPAGRQAIAAVVGSATREVVAGVSNAMADRFTTAWFLLVLLLGAATAMLGALLLRATGAMLLPSS